MRWLVLVIHFVLAPASTPTLVRVPAGRFVMGSNGDELDERPAHRVTLSAFFLDRDEVTVARYAGCVVAGQCVSPRRPPVSLGDPVNFVSWNDAAAYCRFVGKRLPSEAEWERAARGTDGRTYPWGNTADCSRANFGNYKGEGRCPDNPGRLTPPGLYPSGSSVEGARDLAGNVWEWVADRYDPGYYARSPSINPPGTAKGLLHVARGGACCSLFSLPRTTNRVAFPPDYTDEDLGFRCAESSADSR